MYETVIIVAQKLSVCNFMWFQLNAFVFCSGRSKSGVFVCISPFEIIECQIYIWGGLPSWIKW